MQLTERFRHNRLYADIFKLNGSQNTRLNIVTDCDNTAVEVADAKRAQRPFIRCISSHDVGQNAAHVVDRLLIFVDAEHFISKLNELLAQT
ncbi:hypothetical protein D3C84_1056290 [compost metagenome]